MQPNQIRRPVPGRWIDFRLGPAALLGRYARIFEDSRVIADPLAFQLLDQTQTYRVLKEELGVTDVSLWRKSSRRAGGDSRDDPSVSAKTGFNHTTESSNSLRFAVGNYSLKKFTNQLPSDGYEMAISQLLDHTSASKSKSTSSIEAFSDNESIQAHPLVFFLNERHPAEALVDIGQTVIDYLPWASILNTYLETSKAPGKIMGRTDRYAEDMIPNNDGHNKDIDSDDDWEVWGNNGESSNVLSGKTTEGTEAKELSQERFAVPSITVAHPYPASSYDTIDFSMAVPSNVLPFTSILVADSIVIPKYDHDGIGASDSDLSVPNNSKYANELKRPLEIHLQVACGSDHGLSWALEAITRHFAALHLRRQLRGSGFKELPTLESLGRYISKWLPVRESPDGTGNQAGENGWNIELIPFVMFPLIPPTTAAQTRFPTVHTVLLPSTAINRGSGSYLGLEMDLRSHHLPRTRPLTWPVGLKSPEISTQCNVEVFDSKRPQGCDTNTSTSMLADVDIALRLTSLCMELSLSPDIFFLPQKSRDQQMQGTGIVLGGTSSEKLPCLKTSSKNTSTLRKSLTSFLEDETINSSITDSAVASASPSEAVAYHFRRFYNESVHGLRKAGNQVKLSGATFVILERASDLAAVLLETSRCGWNEQEIVEDDEIRLESIVKMKQQQSLSSPRDKKPELDGMRKVSKIKGVSESVLNPFVESCALSLNSKSSGSNHTINHDNENFEYTSNSQDKGWDWDAEWIDKDDFNTTATTITAQAERENSDVLPILNNSVAKEGVKNRVSHLLDCISNNLLKDDTTPNECAYILKTLFFSQCNIPMQSQLPYVHNQAPSSYPSTVLSESDSKDCQNDIMVFNFLCRELRLLCTPAVELTMDWALHLACVLFILMRIIGSLFKIYGDKSLLVQRFRTLVSADKLFYSRLLSISGLANLRNSQSNQTQITPAEIIAVHLSLLERAINVVQVFALVDASCRIALDSGLALSRRLKGKACTSLLWSDISSTRLSAQRTIMQAAVMRVQFERGLLDQEMLSELEALPFLGELIDASATAILSSLISFTYSNGALGFKNVDHHSFARLDLASSIRLAIFAYSLAGPNGFILAHEQALEHALTRLIFATAFAIEASNSARSLGIHDDDIPWLKQWLPSLSTTRKSDWTTQWLSLLSPRHVDRIPWSQMVLGFVTPLQTAVQGVVNSPTELTMHAKLLETLSLFGSSVSFEAVRATAESNPLAKYLSHSITTFLVGIATVSRTAERDVGRAAELSFYGPGEDRVGVQSFIEQSVGKMFERPLMWNKLHGTVMPFATAMLKPTSPTDLFLTRCLMWFSAIEEKRSTSGPRWDYNWKEMRLGSIGSEIRHTSEIPPSFGEIAQKQKGLGGGSVHDSKNVGGVSLVRGITDFVTSSLASTAPIVDSGLDIDSHVQRLSEANELKHSFDSNRTVVFFVLGGVCSEEIKVFQETVSFIYQQRRREKSMSSKAKSEKAGGNHREQEDSFNFFDDSDEVDNNTGADTSSMLTLPAKQTSLLAISDDELEGDMYEQMTDGGGVQYMLASTHVAEGCDILFQLGAQLNALQESGLNT